MLLYVNLVGVVVPLLVVDHNRLDVDEPGVVNLLCQVIDLFSLAHFVVLLQSLIYEIEAIVESNGLQLGDLTENLRPLVLNYLLVVVEYADFALIELNGPV